jgi:hypothetical protein
MEEGGSVAAPGGVVGTSGSPEKKIVNKKRLFTQWDKQTCERLSTLVVGRSVRVQQQLGQFVLELRVVHGHADRPHGARQHVLHLVVRVQHLNQQIKLSKLELCWMVSLQTSSTSSMVVDTASSDSPVSARVDLSAADACLYALKT